MLQVVAMSAVILMAVVLLVWAVLWFAHRTWEKAMDFENQDFAAITSRYEKLLDAVLSERALTEKIPAVIEATNLNTKSLDLLEKAVNQLILRSDRFVDRTTHRQTMVGEEATETRVGNRVVIGAPSPTTRTESGEEGFVDATTGKVVPVAPPTPREIAAMPPT